MATILYDAEVFPHNWMFGFKIIETQEIVQIWDDHIALKKFMDDHKADFFLGFNSNFYDDIILDVTLKGENPYATSVAMVERRERFRTFLRFNRMDLAEGVAMGMGLKALESEMGMSIEESEIPFDIDRLLTDEEKEEVNGYNIHDLEATELLLKHRWTSFVKTKMDIVKYFNLPPRMMKATMATMIATGLGAKRTTHPPREFKWYDTLEVENEQVKDFLVNQKFKTENLVFDLGGVEHTMGLGGIHAARPSYHAEKFWLIDVKGYYSLIQINYDLLSRSLPPGGKDKYRGMYYDRLDLQAIGDPSALSLKLGILAVWGATLNKYQLLYDSDTGDLIMVTGQAFLIDLIEKILPYATLIQSNTDGIMIIPHDEEGVQKAVDEWVKRTTFEVTIDKGENLYQKDVNNYVCLLEGKPEAKGGYVASYNTHDSIRAFEMNLIRYQSQGAVIDKAVVQYFLYGVPVEETVMNETDPRRFMFTVKKGARTYSHVEMHVKDRRTNKIEITKVNNVNRLFISNVKETETILYKIKEGAPHIFPRLNTNVFIFNDDLKNFTQEHMDMIDREYYIRQALSRIEDYISPKSVQTGRKKDNQISLRMWWGEEKDILEDKDLLVEKILEIEEGSSIRAGNLNISKMGNFYTLVSATGATNIINSERITPDLFKVRMGNLQNKRVVVERGKKYFYLIERDYDALVKYVDTKDSSEDFEMIYESYYSAMEAMVKMGFVDEADLALVVTYDNTQTDEVPLTREQIEIDEFNYIMYEEKSEESEHPWEISWINREMFIKQANAESEFEVLDIAEKWMLEYYSR